MIERRTWRQFDWKLLLAVLALCAIGVVFVHSATYGTEKNSEYLYKQLIWILAGLTIWAMVLFPDYHMLAEWALVFYVFLLGVLVAVLIFGHTVHGSKSWFHFGLFSVQPSELVKVAAIVVLARYFSDTRSLDQLTLQEIGIGALIVATPMLLILMQGDLGTTLTLLPVYAAMSFVSGLQRRHIVIALILFLVLAPLSWGLLKDYQKDRIRFFIHPEEEPYGSGYQALQAKIAIGSGQLYGKGLKQGSQSQLGFIPYRHTDFIFAVIAEEKGLFGVLIVLLLYLILFYLIFDGIHTARDRLGILICTGVVALLLIHVTLNIGMVIGLLPITGLPLPLISSGGSSMLANFLALGLVMNIKLRRYAN